METPVIPVIDQMVSEVVKRANAEARLIENNQVILPTSELDERQKREFVGRVRMLTYSFVLSESLRENFRHVETAVPTKGLLSKGMKLVASKIKRCRKIVNDMIPMAKTLEQDMEFILVRDADAAERVAALSFQNHNILENLLRLTEDKLPIAMEIINSIAKESFVAVSDEDHESEMIAYGNYCLQLAEKGRKNITKNDYKKFKSLKK